MSLSPYVFAGRWCDDEAGDVADAGAEQEHGGRVDVFATTEPRRGLGHSTMSGRRHGDAGHGHWGSCRHTQRLQHRQENLNTGSAFAFSRALSTTQVAR